MKGFEILRRARDFDRVFTQGKTLAAGPLVIKWVMRNDGPVRVGFCVGKQLGKAVRRNRIKRLLRESWYDIADHALTPADLVFIARRGGVEFSLGQWHGMMHSLLAKAGLVQNKDEGHA